jgi:transposase|tara:strand:+ start:69 stop:557 length:489 start_codon:yes stop_codon:yes gene_type:complete
VPSYSPEFKEQTVKKMMPPSNQSVAQLSRETGVSEPTLYAWKKQFQTRGFVVPAKPSSPDRWDARAKLAAVIQTAPMNEAERSTYCREYGLYPEQLEAWKEAFESMDAGGHPADRTQLVAERKKSRALEKELLRKERALAEAAALLTLSKKARAIWGTSEDD